MLKVSSVILLMVAGVCFGQQLQQRADDNIVVVGNQALPVQWTHQGTIQGAIKQAGPKGVVMIPATYAGTDCTPLSVCNPGTTLLIDLRGGVFQTYPPLASAGNGAGSSGVAPFVVPGTSMVGFIPDQYCAVNGGSSLDYECDLNGALVFNAFGYLEVVPLTDRVQTWSAVQTFPSVSLVPNAFASLAACSGALEGTLKPVSDSTTATWGATITGSGSNHVLAYCDGTNWTVAAK